MMRELNKNDVKKLLTPEIRADLFRRLGVEIDPRDVEFVGGDGWIGKLYMPETLKDDRINSFGVNVLTGAVNDFGSTYQNDLYGFVQDVKGLNFPEAIEWTFYAAKEAIAQSINQKIKTHMNKSKIKERIPLNTVNDMNENLVDPQTEADEALLEYLMRQRGLSKKTLQAFKLGTLHQSGTQWLFIPYLSEGGECTHYKMIAFDPWADEGEEGYGDWSRGENGQKRVYTSGGAVLYPDGRMRSQKSIAICEGEIDVLTAQQMGMNAVTSTAGAGTFTREWAARIAEASDLAMIVYDADEAGREGRVKAGKMLVQAGMRVRFVNLPDGTDFNDAYVEEGTDGIRTYMTQNIENFDYDPASEEESRHTDLDIDNILSFLDTQWSDLPEEERSAAIRGMQRVLAREGISLQRVAPAEYA